jgi:hypothetical protein
MSRSLSLRNPRLLLATAASLLLALSCATASASAATISTNCTELQSTINTVGLEANRGEGSVIVLDGLCDATNLGSSTGVTLPAGSNFSIEGKPGTTSGFDGAGATGPLLGNLASTEAGAMTLSHLTFQHAKDVSALSIRASRVTLSDDSFLENEEQGNSEHAAFVQISSCPPAGGSTVITLTDSTFSGNKLILGTAPGGGAGAWLEDSCEPSRDILEDNTFEGNTVEATGTAAEAEVTGGGLRFVGPASQPAAVSQRGDVFDSNAVIGALPALANYGGGGEWLVNASLLSVGDRFSRNTISGTTGAGSFNWSWGAGLGIDDLDTSYCSAPKLNDSTLEDAVVEGNAIEPGTSGDLGGGGIWVGCTHLGVLDSTVTLNTAPNGAGIEGEPGDQLELANSIVAGDLDGNETAGFYEKGGSLTATFSDVCSSAGSSEALSGAGNICANPLLADNGNSSSFDVHETPSSPTIDAGSNALVPSELTTDVFGDPRILAGHVSCSQSFPAIVDMGADEFPPPVLSCPAPFIPRPPVPGLTHYISRKVTPTGVALTLSCASTDGLGCSGTIFLTSNETLQGKKVLAVSAAHHTMAPVRLGQATFSLAAGATATFIVKLNSTGLELLRHFHAISSFLLANEASPTSTPFIFLLDGVRFSEPPQKHKKHKSKKHKPGHPKPRH